MPRMKHIAAHLSVLIVACALVGTAPTISAQKKKEKPGRNAASAADVLTWPLPPETPRIRYVATYHGLDDFKPAKKPSRFMTLLIGQPDAGPRTDVMLKPYGVAVSASGLILVSDTAVRRVFSFDREHKTVAFVGESGSARLTKPVGIAVDGKGTVFVADATMKRVFGYAAGGTMVLPIGHDGEMENPSGLAVDRARNRLYVADAGKHQVVVYDTTDGRLLQTIGKRGPEPGEFNFPTNVTVGPDGSLYVADTLNFRIQRFNPDGTFAFTFGELGDAPGQLNRPKGVAVDSEGHIYVVDSSFNNFQIFDAEGHLLLDVGRGGQEAGEFALPAGLFIDEQDRIYVADQGNSRVQVFQYLTQNGGRRAAEGGAIE